MIIDPHVHDMSWRFRLFLTGAKSPLVGVEEARWIVAPSKQDWVGLHWVKLVLTKSSKSLTVNG